MATSTAPTPSPQGGQGESLNVIALISGGKDSFFSVLHCLAHGHNVVALANLHPPETSSTAVGDGEGNDEKDEEDLNSFMYQTVGHTVIPLYAEATGIPLYRQPILGGATQGRDYSHFSSTASVSKIAPEGATTAHVQKKVEGDEGDETESMLPLLLSIKRAHPTANALCAGAILSTYQRTRVESVAVRLGLTPLAFLWKFPILPVPAWTPPESADAQLLDDMASAGMEARIIKVASGGLDDSFLWTNVADPVGKARIVRSMRRFGTAANEKGAVIGEGGEFETLVLDGPGRLFKKRIVVEEGDRRVVREGGGCAWLSFGGARLVDKQTAAESEGEDGGKIRVPDLWDARFVGVLEGLKRDSGAEKKAEILAQLSLDGQQGLPKQEGIPQLGQLQSLDNNKVQQWCFFDNASVGSTIETETSALITQIRQRLQQLNLPPSAILTSTILLRQMTDFPAVNTIYGALFDAPNPPSRVCVACGDSLSALAAGDNSNSDSNINIAIYLTVHTGFTTKTDQRRQGLHVQSRSYWAPANIGPYSQAISIPLASLSSSSSSVGDGPRLVTIAGQIPLVPATMTLPPISGDEPEQETLNTQLALSLQHLWRIGLEVGVQWWSSAVAYFPSTSASPSTPSSLSTTKMPMSAKAKLAYKAWKSAHQWPSKASSSDFSPENSDGDDDSEDSENEDSDDENGPDLWDRKFNPKYMSFATTSSSSSPTSGESALPDWKILSNKISKKQKRKTILPPFFAAEVAELPRSAGVEWHAHLGIANSAAKRVEVLDSFLVDVEGMGEVEVHQTAVHSPVSSSTSGQDDDDDSDDFEGGNNDDKNGGVKKQPALLQTILIERSTVGGSALVRTKLDEIARLAVDRLATATSGQEQRQGEEPSVMVRYVDVSAAGPLGGGQGFDGGRQNVPVVPCASLWSGAGERLASVTIYQSVFE
ncbi:hypothetical protein B0T20DRAFT_471333 [Sordaria brevicollis]|uniref:Diphthine--ammonia ligase n=1 Tax=Sordaria brevicollis TaxID=83679 RepID=A0AAE0UA52_SORBR|nr:hypothetical protein B0T20DRAFT_471333 [Sordaria brevicollis]